VGGAHCKKCGKFNPWSRRECKEIESSTSPSSFEEEIPHNTKDELEYNSASSFELRNLKISSHESDVHKFLVLQESQLSSPSRKFHSVTIISTVLSKDLEESDELPHSQRLQIIEKCLGT
jgi:hypothetical protein